MPIYKPTELRQFLSELNIAPKKGLSQNFLIDGNIIRKIVEVSHVEPDDVVLEIGPGPGSLSEELLNNAAIVVAVEKDQILAQALERLKSPTKRLEIFCEDILKFPIEAELSRLLPENRKAKVIANLPYHLTTPILVHLVPLRNTLSTLTLMVQDEVARRFTAVPGTPEYGSFTVFLNFYTTARYAFQVSQHCFYPEPSVQSAVVILELKPPPAVSSEEDFFKMTRTAFSQRRKMLRASLRSLYSADIVTEALTSLNFNPQARPEELSLDDFLKLFEKLYASRR
jgi:16S rRNA (adenine1518-N6/adenine1519-N6)-dimethyltransferase